jgi:2'-5' RNA ligase
MPAHVTILFPFVPAALIDARLRASIASIASATSCFRIRLAHIRRFPNVLYLAPEPPEPFAELTSAVVARYPEYPPYGRMFEDLIPHLTIATGSPDELDAAEAAARGHLPVEVEAREIILLEEAEAGGRRWRNRAAFNFALSQSSVCE